MSFQRVDLQRAGRAWRRPQRDAEGRALCRWCTQPVTAPRRRTFCSDACVHSWKIRTNPGYVRDKVFERDQGICAKCGIDCVALARVLKGFRRLPNAVLATDVQAPVPMPARNGEDNRQWAERWNQYLDQTRCDKAPWVIEAERTLVALGFVQRDGTAKGHWRGYQGEGLWAADHVVPVVEGGGLCDLEGYRTLCHPCHAVETAALAARRAERRRICNAALKRRPEPLRWIRGQDLIAGLIDLCRVPGDELVVDPRLALQLDRLNPDWRAFDLQHRLLVERLGFVAAVSRSRHGCAVLDCRPEPAL